MLLQNCVGTPYIESYNTSVFAQYTIKVDDRENFKNKLESQGIPIAIHYPVPLHLQPVFSSTCKTKQSLLVSEEMVSRVLSLPMHPYLNVSVQDFIAKACISSSLKF